MASVAEIAPLQTEFDVPSKQTRGPDKGPRAPGGFKKAVEEIANVIFSKTRISLEGAAKAVIPSIPAMLSEIADDIRTGSVDKFKISLNKLEQITSKLGLDLNNYNKELGNFLKDREENIIKSEQKVGELREKGAKVEIDAITGKINVLSREEIKQRTDTLKQTLRDTKRITREKDKSEKSIQESRFLTEEEIKVKKGFVEESYEQLQVLELQKQELMSKLNITNEEDLPGTGFMGMGGGGGSSTGGGEGMREYTPDFIMQFADGFRDQLMMFTEPFLMIKDTIFDLLKPLKIFGKLFKPLISGMGKLIKSMGRQILVGMALVAVNLLRILTDKKVLIGLAALGAIFGLKKLHDKFKEGPDGPAAGTAGDIAGEASMEGIGDGGPQKIMSGDSKDPNQPFYDKNSGEIIQPNNPNFNNIKKQLGYKTFDIEDRNKNNKTMSTNASDGNNGSTALAVNNSSSMSQTSNSAMPTTIMAGNNNTSSFYEKID